MDVKDVLNRGLLGALIHPLYQGTSYAPDPPVTEKILMMVTLTSDSLESALGVKEPLLPELAPAPPAPGGFNS